MINDVAYAVRKLVRTVMGMPEDSVRPAKQTVAAGGQTEEIATVEIIHGDEIGTPAISYETIGTVPADVTTENVDQLHDLVVSINFYRRPPASAYLRGGTANNDPTAYVAIADGAFDIRIEGTTRKVSGIDFTAVVTMDDVAAAVQARLAAALANTRCAWDAAKNRFVVTSPTTNQASVVTVALAPTSASPNTDVSSLLALRDTDGALSVNNRAGVARYSNAAFDRAVRLPQVLHKTSSIALMRRLGLKYVTASQPRNLAALVDGTWESRGQIDVTFDVVNRETETIETILTVPLTVNSVAPGGAVHTNSVEVT